MTAAPDLLQLHRSRVRFRVWIAVLLLLIASLALYAWAGGSWNPRLAIPWTFTPTGWLVPAPGMAWFWTASAAVFALLSLIAWMLFNPVPAATMLKAWVSVTIILLLAGVVRVVIAAHWVPLPLDPAALALKALPLAGGIRWLIAGLDMLVIGVLLLALAGGGRSLWWATLYAVHPLVLREITGNGEWMIAAVLAMVLLAALSHRLKREWQWTVTIAAAVLAVAAVAGMAWKGMAFNSLTFELLQTAGMRPDWLLPIAAAVLEAGVVLLAIKRDWPLARTFGHLLVVFFICAPVVKPEYVVLAAALLPLAWNRAAWVLSATSLAAYIVVLGGQRHSMVVPDWCLMLEWIPVLVLEAQELAVAALAIDSSRSALPARPSRASAGGSATVP